MEYKTEKKTVSENFSFEGVSMLDILIAYTVVSVEDKTAKKLNDFYKSIVESAYAFVKERLLLKCQEEYEASPDEKKRFSFRPYRYVLDVYIYGQNEESISFCLDVAIMRKGKRLYSRKLLHVWDKKSACLQKDKKKKSKKETQK